MSCLMVVRFQWKLHVTDYLILISSNSLTIFFTSLWHTIDRQLVQLITEYMSTISFSFLDSKSISATSPQYKCILCWEHRFNLKFILQSQDNNILYNKSLSSSLLCTIFKEKMTQFNTKVEVGKKKTSVLEKFKYM